MMDEISNLIKTIITPLAEDQEHILIETHEDKDLYIFDLHVNSEDAGRMIGKKGRVAQAIRTVIYSQNHDRNKRIKLNIIPE